MNLEELGWDAGFAEAYQALGDPALVPARVVCTQGPISRLADGESEREAVVTGKLRRGAAGAVELPVVGDWVAFRPGERPGELGAMEVVLPRKTLFSRRAAGDATAAQALAANIDAVFLVMGLDGDFNPRRLERYLALTHASGAEPVILLSKADLCEDVEECREEILVSAPSVPIITASLLEGVPPELRAFLGVGRTAALLGSSGAGKSTLLNALIGTNKQKTRAVRANDNRGRHTTSHRELFAIPEGGMVIDSPGLREVQLWEAREGLGAAFDDLEDLARACRYRDCVHDGEPGCAVVAAVERGVLDEERLESWQKLRLELLATAADEDVLARQKQKSGERMVTKLLRKRVKEKNE